MNAADLRGDLATISLALPLTLDAREALERVARALFRPDHNNGSASMTSPRLWPDATARDHLAGLIAMYSELPDQADLRVPLGVLREALARPLAGDRPHLDVQWWVRRAEAGELTEDEQTALAHVLHHFGLGGYAAGGYYTALVDALARADISHKHRLGQSYPAHAAFFLAVQDTTDGAGRLVDAWGAMT